MIVLSGTGVGRAPAALGRASTVVWQNGRPTLDPGTLGWLADRARREEGPIQLVLVVGEASLALWMPMPLDAILGAVVAEEPLTAAFPDAFPVPVVCGVPEARSLISEGMLVLVDSHRGRVCVEPSADEILAVSGSGKRRWLVGAAHAPAVTRSGLDVPVVAVVEDLDAVREAVRQGADGALFRVAAPVAILREAAKAIGGGTLVFPGSLEDAFALAGEARVFHLQEGGSVAESQWREALETSVPGSGVPGRIGIPVGSGPWAIADVDALLVDGSQLPLPVFDLPPVWVVVDDVNDIPEAISGGASVLCVPSGDVASAKDVVRGCD